MSKVFWTVRIGVEECWVADGFELDAERMKEMVHNDLGYACNDEIEVEVLEAPNPEKIRRIQGFTDSACGD